MVSNFDDGKVSANYGTWMPASDAMNGGKSTSKLDVVEPGAANTKGAMQVTGETGCWRPIRFCRGAFFSGYCAHEAGEPVEEERHQLLG